MQVTVLKHAARCQSHTLQQFNRQTCCSACRHAARPLGSGAEMRKIGHRLPLATLGRHAYCTSMLTPLQTALSEVLPRVPPWTQTGCAVACCPLATARRRQSLFGRCGKSAAKEPDRNASARRLLAPWLPCPCPACRRHGVVLHY